MLIEEAEDVTMECFGRPQVKKKAAAEEAAEGAIWFLKKEGYMKPLSPPPLRSHILSLSFPLISLSSLQWLPSPDHPFPSTVAHKPVSLLRLHPRTMPWCHLCHSQGQAQ